MLLATRHGALVARTCAIKQLKALIVGAPEELRAGLRGRSTNGQVACCAALRDRALHTVALVRRRDDPPTRASAARRGAEGMSPREIRRCVKRAIARQLFELLHRYDHSDIELVRVS